MSVQTNTDLDRFRAWLNEHHPYAGKEPNLWVYGREERAAVLRCFAIDLSVSLRYILTDLVWSSDEKLRRIAEAHATYERNEAEAKALFNAWMDKPAEVPQDGHVYECCGKVGRISRHEAWCPIMKEAT